MNKIPDQANLDLSLKSNYKISRYEKYLQNPKQCPHCKVDLPYDKRYNKFCSVKCNGAFHAPKRVNFVKGNRPVYDAYMLSPKTCNNCKKSIPFAKRSNQYCSRSCYAIVNNTGRIRTEESKKLLSEKTKQNPVGFAKNKTGGIYRKGKEFAPRDTRTCPNCNKQFRILSSNPRKSCSKSCVKLGGLREGSGRSKTGYYKGIYCGSTYELAFLIWHLEHGQPIARCTESFAYVYNGRSHKYWPDFKIGSQIYEIKGRTQHIDYVKIKSCNAVLVDHLMMQKYIKYVCDTYHVHKDKLWLLYDNPTLHQCAHCGIEFQPKTKKGIYCSQVCAMKGNRLKRL